MAYTLDRRVTAHDRLAVKTASGIELVDDPDMSLRQAIGALCPIGFGGHFDEWSDEEHAALHALAHDDEEREAIYAAHEDLNARLRAVVAQAIHVWEVSSR